MMLQKSKTRPSPGSRPKRRTRRSPEDLTNRIIQAAAEEFKRVGYAGATTAANARKAGVTEAQLFRYFGSKSNLFRESIFKPLDEHLLHFTKEHLPDAANNPDFKGNAALYMGELQRFIVENRHMITSLVVAQTYETEAGQGVGAIGSLEKYFDRGAAIMKSQGGQNLKVDPKLMVRVSFAAVLACVMFWDWIFPPSLASDEEIKSAIHDFVLEGISANSD